MIKKVKISNFLPIEKLDAEIAPITVLVWSSCLWQIKFSLFIHYSD
ncbi:MAG: hypothetical protein QXU40_01940 [Candidatus Pacearchaeota archaeon]